MLTDRAIKRFKGIETCTSKGCKVKDIFSLMTEYPDIWMVAYRHIQGNQGALTPGVTNETVDGFSMERINKIRAALKRQAYAPKPVKRVYSPKANGKLRPLGIPILVAYYTSLQVRLGVREPGQYSWPETSITLLG